ncbi:unnamed protein product [Vicia faba]|uniref:VQ domain-containing protein n=1 Tax=Vicia faba TaxID=3906 RepID=A0AAV1AGJ4_VICFA|nr:unnamed protein product [Vicia faba]
MESYSTSCSSSNKSSYTSQNTKKANGSMKHAQYPLQSKHSWLHSVRKSPAKTWKKALIAPVKVYTVDPVNFKELVQFLTCAPQFVPPQPDLHNLPQSTNIDTVPSNNWYQYFRAEYFGKNYDQEEEVITPDLLKMNLLSPTSFGNFCFVPPIMRPTI